MVERVAERGKEPEPREIPYEAVYKYYAERARSWAEGKVVIKAKDVPLVQSRQARSRHYSYPGKWCAAGEWLVINQHLRTNSGRHRHQGGAGLFCWEGKGYSIVDDVRYDWEEDDLLLLPYKPGGCMHQHFNAEPEKGAAQWVVMGFDPFSAAAGGEMKQSQEHPDWKGKTPPEPHVG